MDADIDLVDNTYKSRFYVLSSFLDCFA